MKGIIVYYSATGNTRKIAKAIQAGMKQRIEECDIVTLKEAPSLDLTKYDLIGIGSPVWRGREPNNVKISLHDMPFLEGKLCFVFCTHGATPVTFMHTVTSALIQKGLTIIGFNDWYGGAVLPYMPKPYLTDGHPDEIDLKEAQDFGREMAERGQRIASGEAHLIPKLPKGKNVDPLWQPSSRAPSGFYKALEEVRRHMKINMEKCKYPNCRLCVDNCPMDSIDFSVSPPVFKRNCHKDFLCWAICPEGAIEADFGPLRSVHDPALKSHLVKTLGEDEAKGLFRRLVPLEKVGWNTYLYQKTEHPRYVIEEE